MAHVSFWLVCYTTKNTGKRDEKETEQVVHKTNTFIRKPICNLEKQYERDSEPITFLTAGRVK